MSQRHYYRCIDCLTVAAADGPQVWQAECGLCAGRLECMGRVAATVRGDRLVDDTYQCKCDARCVFARGPSCDCKCGGDNHGAGMLAGFDIVQRDRGPVPVLKVPDDTKAAAVAAEWRAAVAALESAMADAQHRGDWNLQYRIYAVRGRVKEHRTHKARMAAIMEVLPDWQPAERAQPAELQAALF